VLPRLRFLFSSLPEPLLPIVDGRSGADALASLELPASANPPGGTAEFLFFARELVEVLC